MKTINLDVKNLDSYTMLIHGNFGVGKTHLLGQALKYYRDLAQVINTNHALAQEAKRERTQVSFINIAGEDGYLTLANFGFGDIGVTVENWEELNGLIDDYVTKQNMACIALDGLKQVGELAIRKTCGERLPSVGKGSDDWQRIHRDMDTFMRKLRYAAPVVICASASDRSLDQISGQISLTPDLPGRQATSVAGKFDFVFVLTASVTGPNSIRRTLLTSPVAATVIRARLPRKLPNEIVLPEGLVGGWEAVVKELNKALEGK